MRVGAVGGRKQGGQALAILTRFELPADVESRNLDLEGIKDPNYVKKVPRQTNGRPGLPGSTRSGI